MGDQAHDFAERKIAEFQAEVRETYQQAQADAQEALSRFLKRFEKEDERQREKVKAGELSEADYKAWRKGKILRSRQLSSTLDQVSRAMTEANQVAVAALAGKLPEVYAENANYAAFQTCEASGLDLAFSLVDAPTVQHMLTAGEALFSVPALDVAKDVAWNRRLMASQLTQGVLLGESIPKIARRVQNVTGSNIATATRTARTAVTGAECAGRVSSYERARGMGIKLKQEWVAALDNRTRRSHRKLDGVKAEVGGTFPNGCRFPGDPTARYAEICNCRCTLVAAVDGFETDDAKRWSRLPEGMTYEEWKAGGSGKKAANGTAVREGRNEARESGAVSGALRNSNDPDGKKRREHAARYYESVRRRDKSAEVAAVAKNAGSDLETVTAAYDHIFIDEHDLAGGHERFAPDYYMAQSWQRLRSGIGIQQHDRTLILHEKTESEYMKSGMDYTSAHEKANKDGYNYQKELLEWLREKGW